MKASGWMKRDQSIMILESCVAIATRRMLRLCEAVCAVACLTSGIQGEDVESAWPQFGGIAGDFSMTVNGALESWPAEGPQELWSRSLGAGNSGIVVDRGRLFTMFRPYTLGGQPSGEEWVIGIDASDGRTLWSYSYPSSTLEGPESIDSLPLPAQR